MSHSRGQAQLPTFVRQALDGKPITVFGTGQQKRCFGYVGDTVEAIIRLATTDRALGNVVNIGNDEEISIVQLAELVKQRAESSSPVQFLSYDQAYGSGFEDMSRRVPSVEKLFALTGFRLTTPLRTVVDEIISISRTQKPNDRDS